MSSILTPALLLIIWTLLIWLLMYRRRIPAMKAARIRPQDARHKGILDSLPSPARAAQENYNHLHEQPTIFYALVFYTHLAGTADGFMVGLAYAYLALRIVHSLVQTTVNIVLLRFTCFALGTLVLMVMAIRNLIALY